MMHEWLLVLSRKQKIFIMMVADAILLPFAFWCAIALRYGTLFPVVSNFFWLFIVIPVFSIPIFLRLGLYRAVIRFLDEKIIRTVVLGVSLVILILTAVTFMFDIKGVPRSSLIIFGLLSSIYIATGRYLARGIIRTLQRRERRKTPVAIYGAGNAGTQTALALISGPEYRPVAFFDDDPELHGAVVAGIRVYAPQNAPEVLESYECYQVLIALPSASRSKRQEIIKSFEGKNVQLKTLPGIGDLVAGAVRMEDIRDVGIEDLLGRDPVPPLPELIEKCIFQKVVLVSGAGGSIGSELCRQITNYSPRKLILLERSEFNLYLIEQELLKLKRKFPIVPVLADTTDENRMTAILNEHQVQTIYHAAAFKHVPLVEANILAGIYNNLIGTFHTAKAAIRAEVETFVLISTDKAVRPTNVMGATKRAAELSLQSLASENPKTCFTMVRFGNVLGSSGSVVPLFRSQIKSGGPLTVTHPEVTRYFMTIPEAAQLVLQAGSLATGGEVFVLDMGSSVKIIDLAKKLIELSGFSVRSPENPDGDIAIEFVGLRPGEKLYEELLIGNNVQQTKHPRIMRAEENYLAPDLFRKKVEGLSHAIGHNDASRALQLLSDLVPEYKAESKVELAT